MILHRAPLPKGSDHHLVTPMEARYGKNVFEVIKYDKFEENANPMYVRNVTVNLMNDWDKASAVKHIQALYSMIISGNYHQLLIRFPPTLEVNAILASLLGELRETDFIAWSPRSFQEVFSKMKKHLKEIDRS